MFEKITISVFIVSLSMFTLPKVNASVAANGLISTVHFMKNGVVIFYTDGVRTAIPSCGSGQPGRYAFDGSTPGGKAQLSGLLAAYVAGKKIKIFGTGTCDAWSDTESVNYFHTAD